MDPRYQVKQYVAMVQGEWCRFRVFTTGNEQYYLFDPLDAYGCSLCNQFPVRKKDLRDDLRRALAHGYGNADPRLTFAEQKARATEQRADT